MKKIAVVIDTGKVFDELKKVVSSGYKTLSGETLAKKIERADTIKSKANRLLQDDLVHAKFTNASDEYVAKKFDNYVKRIKRIDDAVEKERAIRALALTSVIGAGTYGYMEGTDNRYKTASLKGIGHLPSKSPSIIPKALKVKHASEEQMNYESGPDKNPNKSSYSNSQNSEDYQGLASYETNNTPDRTSLPIYDSIKTAAQLLDIDKDVVLYALNSLSNTNVKVAATKFDQEPLPAGKRLLGAALIAGAVGTGAYAMSSADKDIIDVLNFSREPIEDFDIIPDYRY